MSAGIMTPPIKAPGDYINEVMTKGKAKNPAEPEFHQAVQEVFDSLRLVLERQAFRADQFRLPGSAHAHYLHTAQEILRQTAGEFDAFCDFSGTASSFAGCASAFKEHDHSIRCFLVEPFGAAVLAGQEANNPNHRIQGGGYCLRNLKPSASRRRCFQRSFSDLLIAFLSARPRVIAYRLSLRSLIHAILGPQATPSFRFPLVGAPGVPAICCRARAPFSCRTRPSATTNTAFRFPIRIRSTSPSLLARPISPEAIRPK